MRLALGVAGPPHSKHRLGADMNLRSNPADGCTSVLLCVLIELPRLAGRLKQSKRHQTSAPFGIASATRLLMGRATTRARWCCSSHRDNNGSREQPKMSRLAWM